MASSLITRAERRAAEVNRAIRGLLRDGNPHAAFNAAIRSIQGEAAKVRDHRPADAALIDAELAASLARLAARLHAHKPRRPPGCPRVPAPEHLITAFDAIYESGEQS
jgi:hypothetical protein